LLFREGGILELQQFISGSLTEIICGIKDAQAFASENGGIVSPPYVTGDGNEPGYTDLRRSGNDLVPKVSFVDFDIAVYSDEGKEDKNGIGIFVASIIGVGAQTTKKEEMSNLSRIKFSIRVVWPIQKTYKIE
jgi:hypothetical protein